MRFQKILTSAVVVSFLLVGVAGVAYSSAMMGHDTGRMVGCPFASGETVLCPMNILEHIISWQKTFAALPPASAFLVLLAFVFLALVVRFLFDPPDATSLKINFSYYPDQATPYFRALLLQSAISPRAP